jgi:hypothetical protein
MNLKIELESFIVTAEKKYSNTKNPLGNFTWWETTIEDKYTGRSEQKNLSNIEIASMIALAIGTEEIPGSYDLYKTAEGLFSEDFRIIP